MSRLAPNFNKIHPQGQGFPMNLCPLMTMDEMKPNLKSKVDASCSWILTRLHTFKNCCCYSVRRKQKVSYSALTLQDFHYSTHTCQRSSFAHFRAQFFCATMASKSRVIRIQNAFHHRVWCEIRIFDKAGIYTCSSWKQIHMRMRITLRVTWETSVQLYYYSNHCTMV